MIGLLDLQTVVFALVLLNALACLALATLQVMTAGQPVSQSLFDQGAATVVRNGLGTTPYFSVHVPTHNEPPEVVLATLEHLSQVKYENFEVIILDNNTAPSNLWLPVQARCRALGSRFRFYHRDGVNGAKAGALNIAADLAAPEATHFVIVDADYQVTPEFLSCAAEAIERTGADFIQFPQAYRDHHRAIGVATELADYFSLVANSTNRQQAMLLTGTLSVIDRLAFNAAGRWSGDTITEDAELGVRLYLGNHRGAYIQKTVGRGMLPLNFSGLAKQRDRWVAGNVQTLVIAVRAGLLPVNKPALAIWSQLTAWVSLSALPAIVLILLAFLPIDHALSGTTASLASATILLSLLSNPIRWSRKDINNPGTLKMWFEVRRVKLALLWASSLGWLPALFGVRLKFQRTPKSIQIRQAFFMPRLAVTSAVFGVVSVVHLLNGHAFASIASGVLALSWFAARSVDIELEGTFSRADGGLRR